MLRLPVLFLLATGCDLVLGFDVPPVPDICGPFGPPEPLVFAPTLEDPRDFSVDGTGTLGMVHALRTNAAGTTWTGPHAIKLDGNGVWVPDDTRDRPILDRLDGAHVVASGKLFGWIDGSSQTSHSLYEYEHSVVTGNWGQVGGLIDTDLASDNSVGNVIDVPFGGTGAVIRFLVEIKRPRTGASNENQIFIFQRLPGDDEAWQLTSQASPLNSIDEQISPTGGVMTTDHEILVYAARVRENPPKLYATRRDDNTFLPGTPLIIQDVPADADLTEPWIDQDCQTLYFRWDDATWMTRSLGGELDDSSSAP